ncbi:MAG: diaminopimelate epimerase [Verrucomicrobia bacterium]|nr:diaminopimelate epimerase [Verrucomicrobiota bacterium]MCH8525782.1 diaminopimelate epimerase [Kiritimatiellia bacterium]
MNTPFWKMHGAGNDFVLIDDREQTFPDADNDLIHSLARPKYGVGCEGVILIQPSETADFRMRFYNPDGGEVEMCGNGARCVARLAHEIDAAPRKMAFDTVAGLIHAEVLKHDQVRLTMTDPKDWTLNGELDMEEQKLPYHFVNSGVPHVVLVVEDLSHADVATIGAAIRYHSRFQPAGTNVNLIEITGPDSLAIRTYERGVEAETLACGTGMVAAGLVAGSLGLVSIPVNITCASGDVLQINYEATDHGATNVTLTGPAVHVFKGEIDL